MFKKLQNKLLLMNLTIISVLMLAGFTSIYVFTYKDTQNSIQMELHRIAENNNTKPDKGHPNPNDENAPLDQNNPLMKSVTFTIITDSNWNIEDSDSFFDMDNDFLESAKEAVLNQNSDLGKFALEENEWAYLITAVQSGNKITFLDITSQQAMLRKLIYTFLFASLIMLVLIYIISRVLTNRSIRPIKEAFNKQKQFIADASHELKTPLAVIKTNVDVLTSNSDETVSSQSKWIHYIQSEIDRMNKLVYDLLYLAKVDDSEVKLIFSEFDLSNTIESVLLTMEANFYEKNLKLDYTIEPNIKIYGNKEQIIQVMMILLDNAVKYTSENGNIKLTLNKNNQTARIVVTNTGEGISNEHIDKIFDRFYRTDSSRTRKSGGYGLGLSIAKAIISGHQGKISAESILGKSTAFKVTLPTVK